MAVAEMKASAQTCAMCKTRLNDEKHLDHIVPLAMGGTHTKANVRVVCKPCNLGRPKDGRDVTWQTELWQVA